MGEPDAEIGKTVEHAAHREAARGARGLGGHAHQPGQPVLRHLGAAHHLPRMDEDRGAEAGRGLEHRKELRRVEIPLLDVRADLDAAKTEFVHASFQLGARQIRGLHWNRPEPLETIGLVANHAGEVVVEQLRDLECIRGLRPVTEHHRNRGEHLHVDAV